MKKLYLCFIFLVPLGTTAQVPTRIFKASQIAEKGVFSTEKVKAKKELNVDLTQVLRDDKKEKGSGMPYRFGKAVDVNYKLANSGEWHDMEGARIWKLQITSKKALSLNLIFKKLFIPGNGELYIYNEERTVIYGPVTSRDMTPSGKFSSDLIYGQSIILELLEPKASKNKSVLEVSKVIHGYKLAFFGDAQSCNNDINCSTEGSNWQDESDGVAMILLADYTRICSGSLLNHGCQDYTPNILSAFHCADISTNMTDPCSEGDFSNGVLSNGEINQVEDWMFRFQYKSATCPVSEPNPSLYFTFQGSTFRAGHFPSDAILVEMTQGHRGDVNTGMKYLGWDRGNNVPTSGAYIGHPAGDVMKVSTYNNALTNNNPVGLGTGCSGILVAYPGGSLWQLSVNSGTGEGGFSGGPTFDQNGRVVGQLTGARTGCAPTISWSGRLDVSWNGSDQDGNLFIDNDELLGIWLTIDPNVTTTNTINAPYFFQDDVFVVCNTTRTFSLTNAVLIILYGVLPLTLPLFPQRTVLFR